jgi:phage tail protein X
MTITVIEPKRLDTIVYEYYGSLDNLEDVMVENKQYLNKSILDTGDMVELPIYAIKKEKEGVALWD